MQEFRKCEEWGVYEYVGMWGVWCEIQTNESATNEYRIYTNIHESNRWKQGRRELTTGNGNT